MRVKKDLITLDSGHFEKQKQPGDSVDWPRVREQMLVINQGENGERIIESLLDEKFNDLFFNGIDSSGYNKPLPLFALRDGLVSIFGEDHESAIDQVVKKDRDGCPSEWSFQGMSADVMEKGINPLLKKGIFSNLDDINFTVFEISERGQLNIHKISFATTLQEEMTGKIVAFNGSELIQAAGSEEITGLSEAPTPFCINTKEMREYLRGLGSQELVDLLSGYEALSEEKYNKLAELCMGFHPLFITTGTVYSEGEQQVCRMLTHLSPSFEEACKQGVFDNVGLESPLKSDQGFFSMVIRWVNKIKNGVAFLWNGLVSAVMTLRAPRVSGFFLSFRWAGKRNSPANFSSEQNKSPPVNPNISRKP